MRKEWVNSKKFKKHMSRDFITIFPVPFPVTYNSLTRACETLLYWPCPSFKRVAPSLLFKKQNDTFIFWKDLHKKRDCMQKKMHRKLWMSRETIHFSWQSHHSHYRTENDRLLKVTHCFCFNSKKCQLIWSYLQSKRFIWHQSLYVLSKSF